MVNSDYRYVRERRMDIYRRVAEIGWAAECSKEASRIPLAKDPQEIKDLLQTIAARAEEKAMAVVADLLRGLEG